MKRSSTASLSFIPVQTGKPPFALAYADFPEGVRVLGRLEFDARPAIGAALSVEVDEVDGGAALSYRTVDRGTLPQCTIDMMIG